MPTRKPKEYETNKATFCGRVFYIDERAYIPNAETEQLVDLVLRNEKSPEVVVDVGTGSGCMAVCLAKKFPNSTIYAVDVDKNALAVALKNVEMHRTENVICREGSYVDNLEIPSPNVIVANLPWGDERHLLKSNPPEKLAFEPSIALFHPKGILGAYEELISSILARKWKTRLYFETGVIPKAEVGKIVPTNLAWNYHAMTDYSVSVIDFT